MTAILSILLSVFYLLPSSRTVTTDQVSHVYDYAPFESDGTATNRDISPERRAADWFASYTGSELSAPTRFITEGDVLAGGLEQGVVTVLWINIDRVGYTLEAFDAEFDDALCARLRRFVEGGGCLLLTKQSTRLVTKIGRAIFWPSDYACGGYEDGSDTWYMTYDFCTGANRNDHPIYRYTTHHEERDGVGHPTCFPLCGAEGTYRRTNNASGWGDWGAYAITADGCNPSRRHSLQLAMDCRILGGWGHTRGLDYAGMVEFIPSGQFAGSVIAMGLPAYQWGPQNVYQYNVEALTRGCLEYLEENARPVLGVESVQQHNARLIWQDGQWMIIAGGQRYTILGQKK